MSEATSTPLEPPRASLFAVGRQPPLVLALVCLGLTLLPISLERSYAGLGHALDDWDHLSYVAQYATGRRTLTDYLFAPYNEHVMPLWRAWYWLTWRAAGTDPPLWHVGISLAHGLGAACFLLMLRMYVPLAAAVFGAALWSMAGNAGWDTPLVWIPASHLTFGFAWLLAAMACLARYHQAAGWRWPAAMATSMALAVLSMSALWMLLPMLAAQWLFLERRPGEPLVPRRAWLIAWLVPFISLAAIPVAATFGYFGAERHNPAGSDLVVGATRTLAACFLSLSRLTLTFVDYDLPESLFPTMLAGLLAAALALAVPGSNRRLIATVAVPITAYTLLVHVARSNTDATLTLPSGRYSYLPTWAWCGVIAALLAAPWMIATKPRRGVYLVVLVLAGLALLRHHERVIARTALEFRGLTRLSRLWGSGAALVWTSVDDAAASAGAPLRVPNLLWRTPPGVFRLDELRTALVGRPFRAIEIVPADRWTEADYRRVRELLSASDHSTRQSIIDALDYQWAAAELLRGLSARAAADGRPLRLPDLELSVALSYFHADAPQRPPQGADDPAFRPVPMNVRLCELIDALFAGHVPGIEIAAPETLDAGQWSRAAASLAAIDRPLARRWAEALEKHRPARR